MFFYIILNIIIYAVIGVVLFKDIKRSIINISNDFNTKNKIQMIIISIETVLYVMITGIFIHSFKVDIRYFVYYLIISFAIVTPFIFLFVNMTKDLLKLIKTKEKMSYKILFILFCIIFLSFYVQVVYMIIEYI